MEWHNSKHFWASVFCILIHIHVCILVSQLSADIKKQFFYFLKLGTNGKIKFDGYSPFYLSWHTFSIWRCYGFQERSQFPLEWLVHYLPSMCRIQNLAVCKIHYIIALFHEPLLWCQIHIYCILNLLLLEDYFSPNKPLTLVAEVVLRIPQSYLKDDNQVIYRHVYPNFALTA